MVSVYSMLPLVKTVPVAVFVSVKFAGVLTVVLALLQLAAVQAALGVGAAVAPSALTDA